MSARKTERLLNLVICLLATRRYLTAERIRRAVPGYPEPGPDGDDGAFKRMFERDKEELRQLGVPVETGSDSVWDDELGYRIARERYQLPPVTLEPDEAAAVGLAARAWRSAVLGEAASTALRKLRAGGLAATHADPPGLEPRVEAAEPAFPAAYEAVRSGRPVQFDYRGARDRAPVRRRVHPWGVVSRHGRWYLVGLDQDRDAPRAFRLQRVVGPVQPTGPPGSVGPPEDVELAALVDELAARAPTQTATLRLRAGRAGELRRDAQSVQPDAAGWDLARLPFADTDWLAGQIAGYGADVAVLDPPELRAAVIDRLQATAEVPA